MPVNSQATPLQEPVAELARLMEPVVTRLDQMENGRARTLISQTYVNYLRFGVLFPMYRERFNHADGWDRELYVRDIANAIVSKDLAGYLELSMLEFVALVNLAPIMTSAEAADARADVERLAPWPYDGDEFMGIRIRSAPAQDGDRDQRCPARHRYRHGFRVIYYGFYIIGIGAILVMVVTAVQRRPASLDFQIIGSSAILYAGTISMTALGDVGGVRYLVPIWPCIAVSWIFAADWLRRKALAPRPEFSTGYAAGQQRAVS